MSLELFISILVLSATATSIGIEIIKNILNKMGVVYKTLPVAVFVSFIVGILEIVIYTLNSGNVLTKHTILYAMCMGLANVVGSNVGYDKIKAFIYALNGNP